LVVSGVIVALAATAALAQEPERPVRMGVVDIAKVLDEYREFQESDAEYKQFLRERQQQLQERMSVRLLLEEELREYRNLKALAAPTEEQKRKIEQLRAVAEARHNELDALLRVAGPTDEQKQRLGELQALADKADQEIIELQKRLSEEINQRNKELSERLNQKIEAALAAVAREKRLDFILAKDSVLYGGRDVTEDVLAKLNPSTQPRPDAPPAESTSS